MQRKVYEFISTHTNDPIVEWKTCAISGEPFAIFQSDSDFYEKISPTFNGKKFPIPTPTLCPEERQRRRLSRRNLMKLYRRTCDHSGKSIIALYSPEKPYKVFDQKIRRSDVYNPLEYGKDFDPSKSFFQQFKELQLQVPRSSLLNGYEENAEYINHSYYNKDCYLAFAIGYSESCMYGDRGFHNKYCLDFLNIHKCELCYEMVRCHRCYECQYLINCNDCSSTYYSRECNNCKNCIGCYGLNNATYHIYNKKVSPEEFANLKAKMYASVQERSIIGGEAEKIWAKGIRSATYSNELENSFGIELYKSKNCKFIVDGKELENVSYSTELDNAKDCQDFDIRGENASRVYETHCSGGDIDMILFSNVIRNGNNVRYSDNCLANAKNCFGCVGLKQQEYCIFNKQYTQADYHTKVAEIIEHMQKTGERGQFFPIGSSPFGYNETVANTDLPLSKEVAIKLGYSRCDTTYEVNMPSGINSIQASQLATLKDEEILKVAIRCEVSGRPFRIVAPELDFYRKHGLPLPHKHPDVRHEERLKKRPGRELFLRTCDKCGTQMLSVYPQESKFKVYCEACYNKEIYG